MQTVLQRVKNKTYFYKKKINLAEMKHNVGTYMFLAVPEAYISI